MSKDVGVIPPPPGVTPNFEHPAYHSGGIVPIAAVFIPLAAIFMILRVYTKLRIIRVFGLEDWTIIIAYWGAASIVVFVPAVGLAKVAILLFYLRLNPERRFRNTVYVAICFTTSYVIALSLAILFECNPVAKFWDPFVKGKCIEQSKLTLANAILNVIFDFVVLLVPVPMILKLQVPARQKWVIAALFSLGSITCIISIVRIYYQDYTLKHSDDVSWYVVTPTSLVFVECNLSIICGCAMVLRPFIRHHFPLFLGGDSRRYKSPGPAGSYDGPHGPNSRSEYKTKISSGYGKGSRAAGGRSWPGGVSSTTKNRSNSDEETAVDHDDMELGAWPSHHHQEKRAPRSESEENIIKPTPPVNVHRDNAPGILKTVDVDVRRGRH